MTDAIIEAIRESASIAFSVHPERVEPIAGGANNLVFRVSAGSRDILAKAYFQHPGDCRDRLGAEFGMLDFLWKNGLRCVPEPLSADRTRQIGFYQFVEGRRMYAGEVTWSDVDQLVNLLAEMWCLRARPGAVDLPPASDSSFSIAGFLGNVENRFRYMDGALAVESAAGAVRVLMQGELAPTLKAVRAFIEKEARSCVLDLETCLPLDQRTLSPADHGFHNTLRDGAGRLTFLDFEYAGWDDPAQMICNACLQPAVPIPPAMRRRFLSILLGRLENPVALGARLRLLYPLFGIKWSLIMLNEFLPVSAERRRFAGAKPEARREEQLRKSKVQVKAVQKYLDAPVFFDGLA